MTLVDDNRPAHEINEIWADCDAKVYAGCHLDDHVRFLDLRKGEAYYYDTDAKTLSATAASAEAFECNLSSAWAFLESKIRSIQTRISSWPENRPGKRMEASKSLPWRPV